MQKTNKEEYSNNNQKIGRIKIVIYNSKSNEKTGSQARMRNCLGVVFFKDQLDEQNKKEKQKS